MPLKENNKLYSEIFGLPRVSVRPKAMCVFFNQYNHPLPSPNKSADKLTYLITEDPFSFAGRVTNLMFPGSTIMEIVPIAMSPDDQVVVFIRLLTSNRSFQTEEQDSSMVEIYDLCRQRLESEHHEIPLQEIEASNSLGWRLFVHRRFVKPLYYLFSNLIIKREVFRYAATLYLGEQSLICDVGCGYDHLAMDLAKKYGSIALLNDPVSKPVIQMSRKRMYPKAVFMNENALELKMSRKADLLICKNILHHMSNSKDIGELFEKISTLSNALVIIDPEKPETTILGKIWNAYYRRFLLDQGEEFIDFETFKKSITQHFPGAQVSMRKIRTIKGNFMAAFINKI
ncbi:MAG: class I SAM-dependent methyltransferase [Nanoarchaeota archaeon]|nr:class I SAM-dependent methyltransferase [Nanoarchaeota archaeon]